MGAGGLSVRSAIGRLEGVVGFMYAGKLQQQSLALGVGGEW